MQVSMLSVHGISCPSFPKVRLEFAASLKPNGGDGGDHGGWEQEAILI